MPSPKAYQDTAFSRIDEALHAAAATVECLLDTHDAPRPHVLADRLWGLYMEVGCLEVVGANEHDFGVESKALRCFAAARSVRSTEPATAVGLSRESYAAIAIDFARDVHHFVRDELAGVNELISSIAHTVELDAGASAADEWRIIAALDAHLADKHKRRFVEQTLARARVNVARLFRIAHDEHAAEPAWWRRDFRAEVSRIISGVALELDAVKHDAAAPRRDNESHDDRSEGSQTVAERHFGPYEFKAASDGNLYFTAEQPEAQCETDAFNHTPDFASVRWRNTVYTFTQLQRAAVAVLFEAHENGTPDVSQGNILNRVNSNATELRSVFKKGSQAHPAWGTLIVSLTKGNYRLALNPPESPGKSPGKSPA